MQLNVDIPANQRVSNKTQYDYIVISADGVKATNDGIHWEALHNTETKTVEDIANTYIVGGCW
jgi:hypothetical protein